MTLREFIQLRDTWKQSDYLLDNGNVTQTCFERGYKKVFYLCDYFVVQSTYCTKRNQWIGFSAFDLDDYLEDFITLDSLLNG